MRLSIRIRNICFISVFTAIIAVCAQISIPAPTGVPFTLQTFAVPLAGIILGAKNGTLSVIIYIFLGILGVPVFTGFSGGFGVIFSPTGGFILSFPVMSLCSGIFANISADKKLPFKYFLITAGLILGAVINYIAGVLMFSMITSVNLHESLIVCVLPFIIPDCVKIILCSTVGLNIRKILVKNKILT